MLYKRRPPSSIIAWLFAMVLFPYVAAIFYFVFGLRKRRNRYQKQILHLEDESASFKDYSTLKLLHAEGISTPKQNQKFTILPSPTDAYRVFMEALEESQERIYLCTYVFAFDKTTQKILEKLAHKASQGLEVKLLIDSLGSLKTYLLRHKLKKYKDAGVEIEFFMPLFSMPFRNYINLRNHRKIYIFDNKKVLSGGMNLADEYLGPDDGSKRWEDILFCVEGSSVHDYFEVFASDWYFATNKNIEFISTDLQDKGNTALQVVPSGPDVENDSLYEALLNAIYSADKKIWIVSPYFAPDESLSKALIIAKHKGLDVRLVTTKESDHLLVDLIRNSFMRELEEAGVKIYLYKGAMMHAKAILFDDKGVMLGSVNFDNRSLFLNYEIATFAYSVHVIDDVETWMQKLMKNSVQGTKSAKKMRIVMENFMRVFAPQM